MIEIFGYCFAVAATTWFLDFCLGSPSPSGATEGRIASRVGQWIVDGYTVFDAKHPKWPNPFKAMGICPICFATWIGIAFAAYGVIFGGMAWWSAPLVATVSPWIYFKVFSE